MTSRNQGNLSVNRLRKCYWSRFRVWGPQFWKISTSFLVHDNTPTHYDTAAPPAEPGHDDRRPSTRSRGPTFSYSLNCNPLLKGQFQEVGYIKNNVTTNSNAVSLGAFDDCFVQLLEGYEQCVAVKRDGYKWKEINYLLHSRANILRVRATEVYYLT
jgi:hypothetical protein